MYQENASVNEKDAHKHQFILSSGDLGTAGRISPTVFVTVEHCVDGGLFVPGDDSEKIILNAEFGTPFTDTEDVIGLGPWRLGESRDAWVEQRDPITDIAILRADDAGLALQS